MFSFERVQKAETITYNPLQDFGGWGIRYGRKGKAYNVRWNKEVLLTLKEGKDVSIGSNHHEVLSLAINKRLM